MPESETKKNDLDYISQKWILGQVLVANIREVSLGETCKRAGKARQGGDEMNQLWRTAGELWCVS